MEARTPVVAEGHRRGWRAPTLALTLGVAVFLIFSLSRLSQQNMPWMVQDKLHLLDRYPLLPWSVVWFGGALTALLARRHFRRRAGRVELRDDRVVFSGKGWRASEVRWEELVSYDDNTPRYVQLHRRSELVASSRLAVPTPTEAVRVAVLGVLDARGLVRKHGSERRGVVLAVATGAFLVVALVAITWVLNGTFRRWQQLLAGQLRPDEATALVAAATKVEVRSRLCVGVEDKLCVQSRLRFRVPAYFVPEETIEMSFSTVVALDGKVAGTTTPTSFGGVPLGSSSEWTIEGLVLDHGLEPGRHEVRSVSTVQVLRNWTEIARCEKTTTSTIDVVPGSIATRTIRLLAGSDLPVTLRVDARSSREDLWVDFKDLAVAVAARVTYSEHGAPVGSATLVLEPHRTGSHAVSLPRLSTGTHHLAVTLTPDPTVAFENLVDVTEIGGDRLEREVVIRVP